MKIDFELDLEKSKLFLEYFKAAIRDERFGQIPANGTGYFENGRYISEQSITLKYKSKSLFVHLKFCFKKDHSLESIENINDKYDAESNLLISDFLNNVLQKVINDKKEKFFKRIIYRTISGCNLPGEYWLPKFRFAPLIPEDSSSLINAERLVVIDQEVEAIDNVHANEIAYKNASRFSAYLSFILDLGLERPKKEELYFLKKESENFKLQRNSTQIIDVNSIDELPQKEQVCNLGEFKNSIFESIKFGNEYLICPIETRKIIRGVEASDEAIRNAFYKCCLLYQTGLNVGRYTPTVRLSYLCGAVESIAKSNQKEYIGFSAFMTRYGGEDKDLYDFIWEKIRSAHWHSGEFNLGEFEYPSDSLFDPKDLITRNIIRNAHSKMRLAILSWLNEQIRFYS